MSSAMDLDPPPPRANNGAAGHGSSPISSAPNSPQRPDHSYASSSRGPGPQTENPDHANNYAQAQNKAGPTLPSNNSTKSTSKTSARQSNRPEPASTTTTGRKKAENATAASGTAAPKEKKPRKPRDSNAPTRKRQKITSDSNAAGGNGKSLPSYAPMDSHKAAGNPDNSTNATPSAAQSSSIHPKASLNPNLQRNEAIAQSPRPSSSGQRYDPIRSISLDNGPSRPSSTQYAPSKPSRSNPSIANLISHPDDDQKPAQLAHAPPNSHGIQGSSMQNGTNSMPPQDSTAAHHSSSNTPRPLDSGLPQGTTNGQSNMMASSALPPAKKPEASRKTTPPKPPRQKDPAPPVPLGSGLLSNAAFGRPDAEPRRYAEVPNECIIIDVPVVTQSTNYVNFMKEVEQKYGFDVAHPRLAEHRKRMKEVAAAGAALESGPVSADEMNLDASEGDSNMDQVGMDEGSTAEAAPKKRRNREDDYDKDDDFIDDAELMWEEQALASKDGYFVWSGPLVPNGDKPNVERANGTTKRGARGGRGRGGAARGETTSRSRTTGAGRGSRGGAGGAGGGAGSGGAGGAARKSRVTKADRAKMENEKQEREKMAATAAKPLQYPGTVS